MDCLHCHLKNRRNAVKDVGTIKSNMLFIFESPTKADDVTGEICSGQDRRLLQLFLKEVGKDCNDFYATCLIHCLPVDRHDIYIEPNEIEILTCLPNVLKVLQQPNFKYVFYIGKLVEKYLMKVFIGIPLIPFGLITKQGGQDSYWYMHNVRKIKEAVDGS